MKKAILLLLFSSSLVIGQNVCESHEQTLIDLNNLDKCVIKKGASNDKFDRSLSIKTNTSRLRYLKKRFNNNILDSIAIKSKAILK